MVNSINSYYSAYRSMGVNASSYMSGTLSQLGMGSISSASSVSGTSSLGGLSQNRTNNQQKRVDAMNAFLVNSSKFQNGLSGTFNNLKDSASRLKSYSSGGVFRPMGYGSDKSSVATVTSDSTIGAGSPRPEIDLSVSQLAQAQQTATTSVVSTDKSLTGASSISLTAKDKTVKLDFNIKAGTDNKTALSEMAKSINSSGMGLTAKVNEVDGKSTLELSSNETGSAAAFEVKSTGVAEKALAPAVTQTAQNAVYSVNGKASESTTNKISINNKLQVTLKGTGDTKLNTQTTRNNENVVEAVEDFAKQYNTALSYVNSYKGSSSQIDDLAFSMGSTRFSASSLSEIGVNVGRDGKLSVDSKKLASALERDPQKVENLIGSSQGLASTSYKKASETLINSRNLYPAPSSTQRVSYTKSGDYSQVYNNGGMFSMLA